MIFFFLTDHQGEHQYRAPVNCLPHLSNVADYQPQFSDSDPLSCFSCIQQFSWLHYFYFKSKKIKDDLCCDSPSGSGSWWLTSGARLGCWSSGSLSSLGPWTWPGSWSYEELRDKNIILVHTFICQYIYLWETDAVEETEAFAAPLSVALTWCLRFRGS